MMKHILLLIIVFISLSIVKCDHPFVKTVDNRLIDFCTLAKVNANPQSLSNHIQSIFLTASSQTCSNNNDGFISLSNKGVRFVHCENLGNNAYECTFDDNQIQTHIYSLIKNEGDFRLESNNHDGTLVILVCILLFMFPLILLCFADFDVYRNNKIEKKHHRNQDCIKDFERLINKRSNIINLGELEEHLSKLKNFDDVKKIYKCALESNKLNIVCHFERFWNKTSSDFCEINYRKLFKNDCHLIIKHLMLNKTCSTEIKKIVDHRFLVYLLKRRKLECLRIVLSFVDKEFINAHFHMNNQSTTIFDHFCIIMSQNSTIDMEIFHLLVNFGCVLSHKHPNVDSTIYTLLSFHQ